jgi:hypothetical protein
MNPQKNPSTKGPRARRLFLRTTADAMNPHVAAMMATATSMTRSNHRRRQVNTADRRS